MARSTICLVDDDPSLRDSVNNLMSSVGFEILVFDSAEAFLASDSIEDTGCLVLDFRLQGMNGLDLMAHLVSVSRSVPTIMLTGNDGDIVQQRALALGATAFLTKPLNPHEFLAAVRDILARQA
jgi:FixJ family two-component response regulator